MKSVLGGATLGTLAPGVTAFLSPGLSFLNSGYTTEASVAVQTNFAGTISRLRVFVSANSLSTAATVVTFRKNGADTPLTLTIPAGATGWFHDFNNSNGFIATDSIVISAAVAAGGTGTIEIEGITVICDAENDADYVQVLSSTTSSNMSSGTAGQSGIFNGSINISSAINVTARRQMIRKAFVLSCFQVYLTLNVRASVATFRSSINAANGASVIAVGAGLTGRFVDAVNTDTIASGDELGYTVAAALVSNGMQVRLVAANAVGQEGFVLCASSVGSGTNRTASATPTYYSPVGSITSLSTTENLMQIPVDFYATVSNLMRRVHSNTYAAAATVRLRINGLDGNSTFVIGAGLTGLFEDSTNSDNLRPGDLITLSIVGGTSGTLGSTWHGLSGIERHPIPYEAKPSIGSPGIGGGSDLSRVIKINPSI